MPSLEIPSESFAIADQLSQSLRRFKQYRTEAEWVAAVLDGVARFVDAAAVFSVDSDALRLRGSHKLEAPEQLTVPLSAGRAFQSAIESRDMVIALRTAGEVSSHLSSSNGAEGGGQERAVLLPILNGSRVAAVLFAVSNIGGAIPVLELVTGMASMALERQSNTTASVQIAPARAVNKPVAAMPSQHLPAWAGLDEEQRRLHVRAKRFSRVKVAEMQLYQSDACKRGREQSDVYLFLKKEIDAARQSYRDQFMTRPGMDDYLHLELVRVAAGGDESKLGEDYPGHMG